MPSIQKKGNVRQYQRALCSGPVRQSLCLQGNRSSPRWPARGKHKYCDGEERTWSAMQEGVLPWEPTPGSQQQNDEQTMDTKLPFSKK